MELFSVKIHLNGDSVWDDIRVIAEDDKEARKKAIAHLEMSWDGTDGEMPPIEYCEIEHICSIDVT